MIVTLSAAQQTLSSQPPHKIAHTTHLKYPCPLKMDCTKKSTKESLPSSEETNPSSHRPERSETCHFKIRPFNAKKQLLVPTIEGKLLGKRQTQGKKKPQLTENSFALRRFSAHQSPVQVRNGLLENGQEVKGQGKENNIFGKIDLFKPLQRKELKFKNHLLGSLESLAHASQVTYYHHSDPCQKFLLVIAFNLLCLDGLKYGRPKTISSHKNISSSPLSEQTSALLQKLSGPRNSKNFINHCRLFYKVRSEFQKQILENHLQQNHLNNYEGIINVRGNITEEFNLYTMKELTCQNIPCIFVEDHQTLRYEIPVLDGTETAIVVPATTNYQTVGKVIDSLQGIKHEGTNRSPKKNLPQFPQENINPNTQSSISPNKLYHSSPQKQSPSKWSSPKKMFYNSRQLTISGKVELMDIELEMRRLVEKVRCCKEGGELKQTSRASAKSIRANRSEEALKEKVKGGQDRSCGRIRQSLQISQTGVDLQGDYKQKLVTYVKILETEKKQKNDLKQVQAKQGRNQDDLEQLTNCLTSRLKNKTPYQMVGELLRNNSRIAKQVGHYLNKVIPLEGLLGTGNSEHSISLDRDSSQSNSFQVHICF